MYYTTNFASNDFSREYFGPISYPCGVYYTTKVYRKRTKELACENSPRSLPLGTFRGRDSLPRNVSSGRERGDTAGEMSLAAGGEFASGDGCI